MDDILPEEMMTLVQSGDRRAFDGLYRYYYPRLMAYACKFVKEEEAEDVVQDAFVYVWRKRENIEWGERFFFYMIRTVHNGCINVINKHVRRSEFTDEYQLLLMKSAYYEAHLDEVSRKLYDDELREAIQDAVNTLPQRCKEIFKLSYFNRLKTKEIASTFNISGRTVEAQIYKALKVLRVRLKNFYEET